MNKRTSLLGCCWTEGNKRCNKVATEIVEDSRKSYCTEHFREVLNNRAWLLWIWGQK